MEFYVPLFISLFLNINYVTINSIFGLCSFSLACFLTLALCVLPIYYSRVLIKNRHRLEEEEFKAQYGAFYEGLKPGKLSTLLFYQFFLVRRVLMVLFLIFCARWLYVQIGAIILINLFTLCHLIVARPFKEQKENVTTSVSEAAMFIASAMLPFLAESYEKEFVADLLIYVLMGSTLMNALVSFAFALQVLLSKCAKKCRRSQVIHSEVEQSMDNSHVRMREDNTTVIPSPRDGGHDMSMHIDKGLHF